MKRNKFLMTFLILSVLSVFNLNFAKASVPVDSLIKSGKSTVYYYAANGNRYVFPNNKIFNSWFVDYSNITTVTDAELAQMPLKGNVTYRPGIRMVKITTNPKVYAVAQGGVLRWVKTETIAEQLYGENWNKNIDDISDAFFMNYEEGDPIESTENYSPLTISSEVTTINQDKNIIEGYSAVKADTIFSGPAVVETPTESTATSTPEEENLLIIDSQNVVAEETSATIAWSTDREADSEIAYSLNLSLSATSTINIPNSNTVVNHSIDLSNLIDDTIYYYTITSTDADGISATTDVMSFTTLQSSVQVEPFAVSIISDANELNGVSSVFVSGNYAYLTAQDDDKFTIVDISDPVTPIVTGSIQNGSYLSGINNVYVFGDYAYTLGYNNNYLIILNISNPAEPIIVGSIRDNENLYTPNSLDVSGDYAYVTSFAGSRLTVVDISDKTNPTVLGSVQDNLKLNNTSALKVDGNFAYVISKNNDRLTVVDISDALNPTVAGSITDDEYLNGITAIDVASGLVFAISPEDDMLTVVDASNPGAITVASSKEDTTYLNDVNSISISGNYAYVTTLYNNYFTIIDIGNPFLTPSVTKSIKDDKLYGANAISIFNNYAYLGSAIFDSLTIVDISKYAVGSVLGIKIKSNPLNLEPKSLIRNNRFDELFYVNENFCLQWVANDQIAQEHFGDDWSNNIQSLYDIGGYDYCAYLE